MASVTQAFASDTKVVVIPLGSSSDNVPGNIKTISVSSVGGTRVHTSGSDIYRTDTCGHTGMVASSGENTFINVPLQLPDNATITSFSGLFCMNENTNVFGMFLMRSDGIKLAQVWAPRNSASTTPQKDTDNSIISPLVDNENYAYYVSMGLKSDGGVNKYPISAHITVE